MEDNNLLSTPMLLNTTTPTLEMKEMKIKKWLFLVVDEMTDILEHFGKKLKQQKEDSWNSVNQQKQSRSLLDRNSWWVWAIYSLFNSSIYHKQISRKSQKQHQEAYNDSIQSSKKTFIVGMSMLNSVMMK